MPWVPAQPRRSRARRCCGGCRRRYGSFKLAADHSNFLHWSSASTSRPVPPLLLACLSLRDAGGTAGPLVYKVPTLPSENSAMLIPGKTVWFSWSEAYKIYWGSKSAQLTFFSWAVHISRLMRHMRAHMLDLHAFTCICRYTTLLFSLHIGCSASACSSSFFFPFLPIHFFLPTFIFLSRF